MKKATLAAWRREGVALLSNSTGTINNSQVLRCLALKAGEISVTAWSGGKSTVALKLARRRVGATLPTAEAMRLASVAGSALKRPLTIPRVRTAKRASGARPVRHVGSRRGSRVAAPPGGDDAGGSGSEPPAEPAQNARPFRSAFQKLGFPLLNRSFSSPLRDPGALMAFALLLARWSR